MTLRLGLLGMSVGNGHPYSWAAIFNGYDPEAMQDCGFPVIPAYLADQSWPAARLPGARVTHVWTQDLTLSRHIAKAALIDHVVEQPAEMLDAVDGILLARDDAKNHRVLAELFLQAGLPVYVDKPVALALEDLEALYALARRPGQIFSCSALRYATELQLTQAERVSLGPLRLITATTPKAWDTYAVHLIDPLLAHMVPEGRPMRQTAAALAGGGRLLELDWVGGPRVTLAALGKAAGPLAFRLYGETGWCDKVFSDSFSAFRSALAAFLAHIVAPDPVQDAFNRRVVEIIEMGRCDA